MSEITIVNPEPEPATEIETASEATEAVDIALDAATLETVRGIAEHEDEEVAEYAELRTIVESVAQQVAQVRERIDALSVEILAAIQSVRASEPEPPAIAEVTDIAEDTASEVTPLSETESEESDAIRPRERHIWYRTVFG